MNIHSMLLTLLLSLSSTLCAMQASQEKLIELQDINVATKEKVSEISKVSPLVGNVLDDFPVPAEHASFAGVQVAEQVTQKYSSLLFPLSSSPLHVSCAASAKLPNKICAVKSTIDGKIVTVEEGPSRNGPYYLKIWSTEQAQFKMLAALEFGLNRSREIALSANGKLALAGQNGLIEIFDMRNSGDGHLRPLNSIAYGGGIKTMAFSPDGSKLAVSNDGSNIMHTERWRNEEVQTGLINIFDVQTGLVVGVCGVAASQLAFNAEGTRLVSANKDARHCVSVGAGRVMIWDVAQPVNTRCNFLSSSEPHVIEQAYASPITQVTFSNNGSKLVASSESGRLQMWSNVTDNANLADANKPFGSNAVRDLIGFRETSLPSSDVSALAFSPNARRLATGGRDGLVLLTARDGLLMKTLANVDEHECVKHLAFCSDDVLVTSADGKNELKMWKLSSLIQGKWTPEQALLLKKLCEGKLADLSAPSVAATLMTFDPQTRDSLLATFKMKLNEHNEVVSTRLTIRQRLQRLFQLRS